MSSNAPNRTVVRILVAISFSHLLNDMLQSLLPAVYPILKHEYALNFAQVGLITLTYQITASLLQPLIGHYTDRRPQPYSLAVGMGFTFTGILALAFAPTFIALLGAAALVGIGSSVFHPESSRVARLASGGQHGLAQSVFQVGGNAGGALGPLLAAFIVVSRGPRSIAWFSLAALAAIVILVDVGHWYGRGVGLSSGPAPGRRSSDAGLPKPRVRAALTILMILVFSKYFYLTSLTNYYTFFLIQKFGVSVQHAQLLLFLFLGAVAAGTMIGGPVGDRIGRKPVIWWSILGVLPFTLVLPYANLVWTAVLTVIIGVVLASAFSAILVYAQELLPDQVGLVSGLFFGLAFGFGGLGAAVLGLLADHTSIDLVYRVCAFLPALGILAAFLPHQPPKAKRPRRDLSGELTSPAPSVSAAPAQSERTT